MQPPQIVSSELPPYLAALQAVPTALGGVWGLIVTMLMPNFARCAWGGAGRAVHASAA